MLNGTKLEITHKNEYIIHLFLLWHFRRWHDHVCCAKIGRMKLGNVIANPLLKQHCTSRLLNCHVSGLQNVNVILEWFIRPITVKISKYGSIVYNSWIVLLIHNPKMTFSIRMIFQTLTNKYWSFAWDFFFTFSAYHFSGSQGGIFQWFFKKGCPVKNC